MSYSPEISRAVKSFWITKEKQGNVLAGKQLDAFLELLCNIALEVGIPKRYIFLKNNHIPGYYRATKDWDFLIISPTGNLIAAIELKSQVGSYGNNLNNRIEESIGSSDDFWLAFREKIIPSKQTPWLGYLMVVGEDDESTHVVRIAEPHYPVQTDFINTTYLDRYKILGERLILEHKYSAVGLIATQDKNHYRSLSDRISIESFLSSYKGHLLGLINEFN